MTLIRNLICVAWTITIAISIIIYLWITYRWLTRCTCIWISRTFTARRSTRKTGSWIYILISSWKTSSTTYTSRRLIKLIISTNSNWAILSWKSRITITYSVSTKAIFIAPIFAYFSRWEAKRFIIWACQSTCQRADSFIITNLRTSATYTICPNCKCYCLSSFITNIRITSRLNIRT